MTDPAGDPGELTASPNRLPEERRAPVEADQRSGEQQALHESEAKYRMLFDSIDEGFCTIEVLFDEAGTAFDYRFLETNPAFVRQTGIENGVGKTMRDIAPEHEAFWFETYGHIARTGEALRFEHEAVALHPPRYYDVYAFRFGAPEEHRVAILFNDISERKQREEQQEFLLKLSDALRAESSADAVANRALQMLYEQLRLDRCSIGVYRLADDRGDFTHQVGNGRVPPMPDGVRLSDFPEALRVAFDRTLVINDVAETEDLTDTDKRTLGALGLGALVAVTLRKGQHSPLWSIVAVSASPRHWTQDEIALVEAVTERTWSAVAHARAEAALRESEQQLRAMAENLPGGAAFIVDRDLQYTLAEGEVLRTVGATPEQFIGKTIYEALDAEQVAEHDVRYRQALRGEPFTHKHQIDNHSFVSHGVPLRNTNNDIYAVLVVSYDITEQRQAEQALRESEERFRTLTNAVPQVIWANDTAGKAIYFNQRWFEYSGLNYEQSAGPGWQAIVHPDDAPVSVERWQRALAAGTQFDTEYRLRRSDDLYRWFIGRNVPLRDDSGQIVGWFGSATDIEDLKQAEAARRESEERFRLLVEGARDYAMFLLDPENRITYWSVGAERVFGYPQAEALGQRGTIIFTPEDRALGQAEREILVALEQGSALDRRWHIRKDGTRLFLDGAMIRLDDAAGGPRGFVKIGRDATAQHEAEAALQRAHDQLEHRVRERTSELAAANQLLHQEIAERKHLAAQRTVLVERLLTEQEAERQRIAHELHDTLGQFLSALNIRLSMAQSRKGLPSQLREELAQLLTLSSQIDREVDRLTMELRPPALEDLGLAAALDSYAEEWSATSGIPVDVLVIGLDSSRLRRSVETTVYRIVQEALTNVLKHAQASVVSVVVERHPRALRVIIEDNGVGFEANAGSAPDVRGRQVGLIGMAERAALIGGELTIETAPGAGTTIYLQIPLART